MGRLLRLTSMLLFAGCASEPGWIDDRFFVRVDEDADLYVHAIGEGTSNEFILFLHDGPGIGSACYERAPAASLLQDEAVMLYLDQRSSGASEGTTPVDALSLELLRDDILMVMDVIEPLYMETRTGQPRLWLMGHGWGGLLGASVLFETTAPERLAGWIEVSGTHDVPMAHAESRQRLLSESEARLSGQLDEDEREQWKAIQDVATAVDPIPRNSGTILQLREAAVEAGTLIPEVASGAEVRPPGRWSRTTSSLTQHNATRAVSAALLDETLERSFSDQYRELELPTLLLSGKYDFIVPSSLSEDVQLRIASERVEHREFAQSEHLPMFNEPEAFAEAVLDFIGSTP